MLKDLSEVTSQMRSGTAVPLTAHPVSLLRGLALGITREPFLKIPFVDELQGYSFLTLARWTRLEEAALDILYSKPDLSSKPGSTVY